ncbi:hypothetical protein Nmel_005571 [Mimus melanotis]
MEVAYLQIFRCNL